VNRDHGLVLRAKRAIDQGGDTRLLKRELLAANPYIHRFLARRGLEFRDGAIQRAS
jgi:hypothetical protein